MNRVVTVQPPTPPHNLMNDKGKDHAKKPKGRVTTFIAKAQKKGACSHCKKPIQRDELILTAKKARSRDLVGNFCPPQEEIRVGQQEVRSPCFDQYAKNNLASPNQ